MPQLNYAAKILALFGGIRPFAAKYNDFFGDGSINPSTPAKWLKNGGRIPRWRREDILVLAKEHKIALKEADLGPAH